MLIADVPAVFAGGKFATKIPLKVVHSVTAAIFALLGVATLIGVGATIECEIPTPLRTMCRMPAMLHVAAMRGARVLLLQLSFISAVSEPGKHLFTSAIP